MTRIALVCMFVAGACGTDAPTLRPIIDVPPETSDAFPYGNLDTFVLSIARAGDPGSIREATLDRGAPLSLADIPFGDALVVHLSGRAAASELSYGRTCALAGRADGPPEVAEPHLYLSRVLRWGPGPQPIVEGRDGVLGYALPDGSAVFVGGGSTVVERYDPLERAEFAAVETPVLDRQGGTLSRFDNGLALLVGGVDGEGDAVETLELIDVQRGTSEVQELPAGIALVDHAAVTLVDGSVLVTGGRPASGNPTRQAWQFSLGDSNELDDPVGLPPLVAARAGHTLTRLGNEDGADVLVVGGYSAGSAVGQVELYRPSREEFEVIPGALVERWGHQAVRLRGGSVLIAGGFESDPENGTTIPASSLKLYDPGLRAIVDAGELPADAGVSDMTVTPLPDGRVLLAGGRNAAGERVAAAFVARFDASDGRVDISRTFPLDQPRAGHAAVSLCDGTILVVGGADGGGGSERYNPTSENRR